MREIAIRYAVIALSMVGSAISLSSCDGGEAADAAAPEETMMTEYSENLSIVMSQNGRRSYHFQTPLVEGYTMAREPYREFRKGVKITTYQDDSLSTVDAVLTANYAIYYENRKLWEAKGDVVAEKSDGKTLYTQQLFWNAQTKKIYSNVDSKIVQSGGRDVFIGEGFESDEGFKDWRFRRMKGRMGVDVKPTDAADSTQSAAATQPQPQTATDATDAKAVRAVEDAPKGRAGATMPWRKAPRGSAAAAVKAMPSEVAPAKRQLNEAPQTLRPVELQDAPQKPVKKK
ncbi:MAG: LPS export ABC transporter periplasmic protein LptC [Alistipes sp.]